MVATRADAFFRYDGPEVREGLMDVQTIAPAILSIGNLFTEANKALNGNRTTVVVKVATPERGSFGVGLVIDQELIELVKSLFNEQTIKTAKQIVEVIVGGGGLIALIQFLRGLRAKKEERLNNQQIQITNNDGDIKIFQAETINLYKQVIVREAVREVVRPLERPGINKLEIEHGKETRVISDEDVPAFRTDELPGDEQVVADNIIPQVLQVLKPSFDPHLSFYVNDGSHNVDVFVEDQDFMKRVDAGDVTFRSHDLLFADIHVVTYLSSRGTLRAKRVVVKVRDHKRRDEPIQNSLLPPPADDPDSGDKSKS